VSLVGGNAPGDVSALERPQPPAAHAPLGQAEKHSLLAFARETIRRMLTTETAPLARGFPPALGRKQGAFVTLKRKGQLRGCIGHMAEDQPLYRVVGAMALQAAFNDRRFAPIAEHELSEIDVEVSVLTPRRRVAGPAAVVLGRDGVGLQKAGRSAVFLPQVPGEQGWNLEQTLEGLCRKAGLPQGCWRDGAQLYTFQADVFHEG
jgi:AmmeMemoRadiSam system protein A